MKVRSIITTDQDSYGGVERVNNSTIQRPCRIRLLNATEGSIGGKNGERSTHRIYCDNVKINGSDDIIVDGRVYNVNYINSQNNTKSVKKGSLEIDCTLRM